MTEIILPKILTLVLVAAAGAAAAAAGLLKREGQESLSKVLFYLVFPAFTFHRLVTRLEAREIISLWPAPLLGFSTLLAGFLLGHAAVRLVPPSPARRGTILHLFSVNNYFFLALPILVSLSNTPGFASGRSLDTLLFLQNLGASAAYWTIGVWTLGGSRPAGRPRIPPSTIAILAGVAGAALGLRSRLSPVLLDSLELIGSPGIPMILILAGAQLWGLPLAGGTRIVLGYAAYRLVLFPLLFATAIAPFPLAPDVRLVALVVASMPAAITSIVVVREYGGDADLAARAVLWTTILSAVTIPAVLTLLGAGVPG